MSLRQDLRVAARSLAARPGFTGTAVLTLALGIGSILAIFAVVNAVLIRPLPYPESNRIVVVNHHAPGLDLEELNNSPGTLHFYQTSSRALGPVAGVDDGFRNLIGLERPERVAVVQATPEIFDVLRTEPAIGRRYTRADAEPGAAAVAVLTHRGWRSQFGRAPDVLGTVVRLDGTPTEIIGVMPEGFAFPDPETAMLLPMHVGPNVDFGTFGVTGVARLAEGVSAEAARREVEELQARIPEASAVGCDSPCDNLTADFLERAQWRASVTPLRDEIVGGVEGALWIVLAMVSFVLLIACANVANLFLVRAESRQREVSIRAALGAGRWRVAGSFLAESLLLGAAGGVVGVALAAVGVRAIVAAGPPQLPRLHEVGLDASTLALAVVLSLLSALLFGALPLTGLLTRVRLAGALREGRSDTGSRERNRARKVLIIGQMALALILLVGSGLMLRSFRHLAAVETGIDADGVLTVGVSLGKYETPGDATAFYQRVLEEVRGAPGVTTAGAATSLPIALASINGSSFDIASRPREETELPPVAMYAAMTPGLLETLRIPVVEGRAMEPADLGPTARHVWVSRLFARRFLEGRALGEQLRFGPDTTWLTVAGVVGDVHWFGLDEDVRPMAFLPMTAKPTASGLGLVQLAIRTAGEPETAFPSVSSAIERVAPSVPLTMPRTMRDIVDDSMAETAFTMTVLGLAAVVALLLGAVGLYGVISYVVTQRTREIGVRIALGAQATDVRRLLFSQGLGVVLAGLGIGLAVALALTGLMEGILFEVSARDPLTFTAVVAVLVAVSLCAIWLPARRATRVSPVEALRGD